MIKLSDLTEDQLRQFNTLAEMYQPEELHPDLVPYVETIAGFVGDMQVLRHPLVQTSMYSPMQNRQLNLQYQEKQDALEKAITAGRWHKVIFLHERPWRFNAFTQFSQLVGDQYWPIIGHIWTDSENIWQHLPAWKKLWASKKPGREMAMSERDQEAYAALPDQMTVYRGVNTRKALRGMSWTLDRERAVWFTRLNPLVSTTRLLIEGTVEKKNVFAYFGGRQEQEVVLLADTVKNMRTERIQRRT